MAISQIFIDNLDSTNSIALSAVIARSRQIQRTIPVASSIEVGADFSIDELSRNAQLQYLITKGKIRIRPVAGTSDLAGMPGYPDTFGRQLAVVHHVRVAAGVAAAADDVIIYNANSPRLKILDACWMTTAGAAGGRTVTLRTATGGAGSAVSDAFSAAANGVVRNVSLASVPSLAAGSTLVARRSHDAVAGDLLMVIENS